jgi:hypothetical protein
MDFCWLGGLAWLYPVSSSGSELESRSPGATRPGPLPWLALGVGTLQEGVARSEGDGGQTLAVNHQRKNGGWNHV